MKGVGWMKNMMRGAAALASGILLLAGGAGLLAGCREKAGQETAEVPRPLVTGVEVATVSPLLRETIVEAVGTVRARTIAVVASQVMGRVTTFPVSEGSRVEKGALLVTIDAAALKAQAAAAEGMAAEAVAAREEAESAIAQAEAGMILAEKTYARFRKLYEEKAVTQQEFEEVEVKRTVAAKDYDRALNKRAQAVGRIARARGEADAAKAMLSYTTIRAPFAGVVTEKKADAGSMAAPGMPLLTLEDTRRYRLEAAIPETHLSRLSVGSKVEVVLDASPEKPLPAIVTEIVPVVDPTSRTFLAKADVSGPGLRTGMFGRLRFSAGKGTVLAVPQKAVSRAGGFDGVFVVTPDNVARLVMVKTGMQTGDRIEILSGIDPGSRVAVSPLDKLADGARVEIRK
ncbi:MAG TPA: efflux RND transporter periplasmic adaptor subunit [Candidatus Limnocylindrales bacterium]|nr:efflux RND transporter periplasmic adaptor subunit [Candidatus Limnocylindrales bacterium]